MDASARRRAAFLVGAAAVTLWTVLACRRHVEGSAHGSLKRSASSSQLGVSTTVTPASSVRCNRIKLPARLHNSTTGPYNPAAARHPDTGEWMLLHTLDEVSFTLSDMVRSGTNLGQLLNTHALLVRLGRRSSPIFQHSAHKEAALLEYDGSYLAAAQEARATYFKCGDWRPFVWRNSVYLAHWIYYGRGQERMAISALDERAGLVRLVHVLSPLPPATTALKRAPRQAARAHAESLSAVKGSTWEREKNWGRVEDRGQLVRILYGEGDRFGCWLDVAAQAIVWHVLGAPGAGAALPPAPAPQPGYLSEPALPAGAAAGGDARAARPKALAWGSDLWLDRGVFLKRAGAGTGAPRPAGEDSVEELPAGVRAVAHGRHGAARRRPSKVGRLSRTGLAWSG